MAALRRLVACQRWQMLHVDGAPVAATLSQTSRAMSESGTELLSCGNRGMSSSREASDKAATDAQREDILETGKRANQDRVKESPAPTKQKWWKPDPVTGVWVPEDTHEPIDTAQPLKRRQVKSMLKDLQLKKIQELARKDLERADKAKKDSKKKGGKRRST